MGNVNDLQTNFFEGIIQMAKAKHQYTVSFPEELQHRIEQEVKNQNQDLKMNVINYNSKINGILNVFYETEQCVSDIDTDRYNLKYDNEGNKINKLRHPVEFPKNLWDKLEEQKLESGFSINEIIFFIVSDHFLKNDTKEETTTEIQ